MTVANTLAADTSSVAFIQLQGAWTAVAATAIFCVLIQTLFAHDVDVGTIWCALSRCDTLAAPPNSALVIQRRAFAAVCLFLDIFVLLVHWCLPVHPKFVVVRRRRLCIRLHLISGTLQCAAGPAFYALRFGRSPDAARWVCVLTAAVGLCLHLPTALYLLRSAFGAVRLTMPLFLFASSAYGYTLGRLLIAGVSGPAAWLEHAFLAYWLCLHVYALNRLCFSLLTRFNLLAHARYDLSVLLGTAAALPAAIGWASLPLALAAVLVFNTAFVCAMDPASQASSDIFSAGGFANRALVKPHLAAPEGLVVAPLSAGSRTFRGLPAEVRARLVFRQLDSDASGTISRAELGNHLVAWGLPRSEAATCLAEAEWRWANAHNRASTPDGRWQARCMAAAARPGLAPGVAGEISRAGGASDGYLDFAEFYEELAPVWQFAAAIVDVNSGAEERVARRVASASRRLWGRSASQNTAAPTACVQSDGV
mmetsp:Transcript_32565/g.103923  ORF Transcript_32565/g.103923 Transcript_32565/m.103923 type:complete len:481 (-) Transcript_32565:244-1686(-)